MTLLGVAMIRAGALPLLAGCCSHDIDPLAA
jgi:hypothetical protein